MDLIYRNIDDWFEMDRILSTSAAMKQSIATLDYLMQVETFSRWFPSNVPSWAQKSSPYYKINLIYIGVLGYSFMWYYRHRENTTSLLFSIYI